MAELTVGERASELLLAQKERIAEEVTQILYAEMPELMEKYGAVGRAKCLQDIRYNVEHLAPAVALGEPAMFAGYVRWLYDLLRVRNISLTEISRSLELMDEVIGARLPHAEAAAVSDCIRAGSTVLKGDEKG